MRISVSPPPVACATLAKDPALQTWFMKAGQHLTDSSNVETIKGTKGEILKVSRSGSRIFYEYAGTAGDSWVFHGAPITLPPSTSPQKDWKHIEE